MCNTCKTNVLKKIERLKLIKQTVKWKEERRLNCEDWDGDAEMVLRQLKEALQVVKFHKELESKDKNEHSHVYNMEHSHCKKLFYEWKQLNTNSSENWTLQ